MFARQPKDLMDGAGDLVAGERRDHPLDLPPMAETRDIAVVAAAVGADCRLEPGVVAVAGDQLGGIGQCNAAVDEWLVHAAFLAARCFPTADDRRQRRVNHNAWLSSRGSAWPANAQLDPRRRML